jgi:CHRD domain
MRQHISYAVLIAAIAAGLSTQVQGRASESPAVEQQDNAFFSFLHGRGRGDRVFANLQAEQEVPAVSSVARGRFRAEIDDDQIEYEMSFEGLQGTITQSHIHFGQPNVNGGIMVWLCGTGAPGTPLAGPEGTQTCPQSGTISGTITAENVVAIGGANAGQQIAAGEFAEFLAAVKKELAYANIHTNLSAGGEIRGQIKRWSHR